MNRCIFVSKPNQQMTTSFKYSRSAQHCSICIYMGSTQLDQPHLLEDIAIITVITRIRYCYPSLTFHCRNQAGGASWPHNVATPFEQFCRSSAYPSLRHPLCSDPRCFSKQMLCTAQRLTGTHRIRSHKFPQITSLCSTQRDGILRGKSQLWQTSVKLIGYTAWISGFALFPFSGFYLLVAGIIVDIYSNTR